LEGPFDFTLTGVLTSVANPLRDAGVGILTVSTYDTDYVMVKQENIPKAVAALEASGHSVRWVGSSFRMSVNDLQVLAERFRTAVEAAGTTIHVPLPRILIQRVPGVSVYDPDSNEITYPSWEETPVTGKAGQERAAFQTGEAITGQQFFAGQFRYFFVHELSHWLQMQLPARRELKKVQDKYSLEAQANRVAVAFLASLPEERGFMERTVARFERLLAAKEKPLPEGESGRRYFNELYGKLGAEYPYFQYQMVLDAWRSPARADWSKALEDLRDAPVQ